MPKADGTALRKRYPCEVMVLSVGRLVPYKGYRYLVEAAALLPDDWKVVIGGSGPLQEELQGQITSLGLEGKVIMPGYLADNQLPAWFAACDVFVLGSIMKTEAFGIVQIEAMSCGKPVVTTRIPGSGTSWVNAEGESGLTVAPEDAPALAAALQEAAARREQLGEGARNRFLRLFTTEKMIEKIKEIYEEL